MSMSGRLLRYSMLILMDSLLMSGPMDEGSTLIVSLEPTGSMVVMLLQQSC